MKLNINAECEGTNTIECDQLCIQLDFLPYTFRLPSPEKVFADNCNANESLTVVSHKSPGTVGTLIKCFLVILDLLEQSEATQNSYPFQVGLTDILKELKVRGETLPKDRKEAEDYVERIIHRFLSTQTWIYPRGGEGRWTGGSLLGFVCSKEWVRGRKDATYSVTYSIEYVMDRILDERELNALRRAVGYPEKPLCCGDSYKMNEQGFEWKQYLDSRITATIKYGAISLVPELLNGSQMKALSKLAGLDPNDVNAKEYDDYNEKAREENKQIRKRPYKCCEIRMVELYKYADLSEVDKDARVIFVTEVESFVRTRFSEFVKDIRHYNDDVNPDSDSLTIELWCKRSVSMKDK